MFWMVNLRIAFEPHMRNGMFVSNLRVSLLLALMSGWLLGSLLAFSSLVLPSNAPESLASIDGVSTILQSELPVRVGTQRSNDASDSLLNHAGMSGNDVLSRSEFLCLFAFSHLSAARPSSSSLVLIAVSMRLQV